MSKFEAATTTVKQKNVNEHLDIKRVKKINNFQDLSIIRAPQDSGIMIAIKIWHILVDQYT